MSNNMPQPAMNPDNRPIPEMKRTDTPRFPAPHTASGSTKGSYEPPVSSASTPKAGAKSGPSLAERKDSIGVLFSRLSEQIHDLIYGEIDLAKAKASAMVKKSGTGIALLAVAGILALYMLGWLLYAAFAGFSNVVAPWLAALIVAAILLVIVAILALVGVSMLKKAMENKPAPQEGIKESVDAVKKGLNK